MLVEHAFPRQLWQSAGRSGEDALAVEGDDQELTPALRLNHDEGRGWRGFHHHATLWIAAYGFFMGRRLA